MAEDNPNICYDCEHDDLEDLAVCTSVSCTQNTARCVSWCFTCKARYPCKGVTADHVSCWDNHLPRSGKRLATHSQRPAKDQVRINEIFHCETDPKKQEALHERDKEARWFIIDPAAHENPNDRGYLYITNRFEYLTQGNIESQSHSKQFPSLVSFIGETGVGKSTLIRALIKLYSGQAYAQEKAIETPVTRIQNAENLTSPTSSGVHLYKDPATFASQTPILFADCEGFNAGAAIPTSNSCWNPIEDDQVVQKIQITSSLYSSISSHPGRSGGVEDLYSRFLYAFSDVVCLVSRNAQTITKDIEKLLIWASRGLQTSVNQTQRKTLILVLNAPIDHNAEWMDEQKVCGYIFNDMADVWKNSPFLEQIRTNQTKANGERICSTKDFILKYFQHIRVCYIPLRKNIHSNEVQNQCDLLRKQITQSSNDTAEARMKTWTQYNIQDLSRLFTQAFEHFARKSTPFDFYLASRQDNPNPLTMADHIMNLLRHIEKSENPELVANFPKIVASAILNNVLRGGQVVSDPYHSWEHEYAEKCNDGITRFYRQHATCTFEMGDMRCICKYSIHDHVHRDKEGNDIGTGHFQPQEIEYCTSKKTKVKEQFCSQYRKVCGERNKKCLVKPSPEEITAQRKSVLQSLSSLWSTVYSYKTCFSCLCAVPDHVLPCGHAQCEDCVSDFGKWSETKETEIILQQCVFCSQSWDRNPQRIQIKPPCAGIRVLTLDGGGIRGILELTILKKIEDRIGLGIGIQNFFDLVVGTSTGGIIALGLFVKNLTLEDMTERFIDIATSTFKYTRGLKIDLVQALSQKIPTKTILLLTKLWESIYCTTPLQEALQRVLGESSMFGSAIQSRVQRSSRVAVMTVKDKGKQATAIANYNRLTLEENIDFERAESEGEELKAWEAGLCTAAAPIYFRPFEKAWEATKTQYFDGGLLNNNPVSWASSECKKIWRNIPNQDILVSIGTGFFPGHSRELPAIGSRHSTAAILNSYFENIDGERTWERFKGEGPYDSRIHHRINVRFEKRYCRLDQHERMEGLVNGFNDSYSQQDETLASTYSGKLLREKIDHISQLLIAKLFYFQPTSKPTMIHRSRLTLHQLEGKILCRLEKGSNELRVLVGRIDAFGIVETEDMVSNPQEAIRTIDNLETHMAAVREGRRFEINHKIAITERSKILQIFVRMKPNNESPIPEMPISGFPCRFDDLVLAMKGNWYQ